MTLESGEKLHIITRRYSEDEPRRHFIGEVNSASGELVRITGYAFVRDNTSGKYMRRKDRRTRIIGLADPGNIINVLPPAADIEQARYEQSAERSLIVTDGKTFALDINEFGATR